MASGPDGVRAHRAGRRLALAALFEAEFGQRTPTAILERHLAELEGDPDAAAFARELVGAIVEDRVAIDALIEASAPRYPVVQLARIDRTLLRCGVGEVLHSPTTPAPVAIAEWVELARIYSGEPTRRLMNGVLGTIAVEAGKVPAGTARPSRRTRTSAERVGPRRYPGRDPGRSPGT
jgi:N utilization substance protein B